MKKIDKMIFAGLLLLSALAFAQADSCNMTLLDEWEIPTLETITLTNSTMCFINDYLYTTGYDRLYILTIDSTESFTHLNSISCPSAQIAYRDTFLYSTYYKLYTFSFGSDTTNPVLLDSSDFNFAGRILLEDTLLFGSWTDAHIKSVNIVDPLSTYLINHTNNSRILGGYGPFSDGNYLYVCGDQQYSDHPEEWYSKAVLEVYDPYTFADSIAFMGRYYFGGDTIGHWHKAYFVDFRQDSFMILGDYPNVFSIWKTNSTRDSFELITEEADTNFYPSHIEYIGDSIAVILGDNQVFLYDFSSFPDYSLLGSYTFDEGGLYSILVNYPYFVVLYQVYHPTTPYPVYLKLLKYTPTSGMNCSYNVKKENDFHIFPNPFNSSCSIELAKNTQSIEITDIRGNTVKTVENPTSFNWQPQNLPSGLYFITVDFGETKVTKKTVYLR